MKTETVTQQPEKETLYAIPLSYRKMENLHIVFWLFPTLIISIIIAWRTRALVSELCHNLAITFWISANSYWMISEFFGFDSNVVFENITYKHLSLIPFSIGALMLAYYYLYWRPRNKDKAETM